MKTQAFELELAAGPLHLVLERGLRDREEGLGVTVFKILPENQPGTYTGGTRGNRHGCASSHNEVSRTSQTPVGSGRRLGIILLARMGCCYGCQV
jgi:hypothetical protein